MAVPEDLEYLPVSILTDVQDVDTFGTIPEEYLRKLPHIERRLSARSLLHIGNSKERIH